MTSFIRFSCIIRTTLHRYRPQLIMCQAHFHTNARTFRHKFHFLQRKHKRYSYHSFGCAVILNIWRLSCPVPSCPVLSLSPFPSPSRPVPSRPVLFCPVLSCPVLSCAVLSCPVLSCPILFCPVLPVLSCPVLFCPVLFCPVLFCPVLFFSVLFCSVLFCPTDTGSRSHRIANNIYRVREKMSLTAIYCPCLTNVDPNIHSHYAP
jgi:hypothetical protein